MAHSIAVVNRSTKVTDAQTATMVAAVSIQMSRDFCPIWGMVPWTVKAFTKSQAIPSSFYQVVILDNSDSSGALGYHDEMNGKPYGRVFVNPVLQSNGSILYDPTDPSMRKPTVSSVLSHEVLEMRADIYVSDMSWGPETADGFIYFKEVCDPVESDQYSITVNKQKVVVSNFVYPEWFDSQTTASKVDFMGTSPGAFSLAPGGYMIVVSTAGGINAVFSKLGGLGQEKMTKKFHPMSRNVRRIGLESEYVSKIYGSSTAISKWRSKLAKNQM